MHTPLSQGELLLRAVNAVTLDDGFKIPSTEAENAMWGHFIGKSLCVAVSPTFYQFITDRMFDELIKSEFKIISGGKSSAYQSLTREEEMALRYVAGYVCRKVREKLQSSSLPLKDDMIF